MPGLPRVGISRDVLFLVALAPVAVFAPNAVQALEVLFGESKKKYSRKTLYYALTRLERTKLLSYYYRKDGKIVFELSAAGKRRVRMFQTNEVAPKRPKRWDRKWRIIFSDISEKNKRGRDALRLKFREWDFYPLQKSVFVCPFPCEEEIAIIRDLFHIPNGNLFLIETEKIPNEQMLLQYFRL